MSGVTVTGDGLPVRTPRPPAESQAPRSGEPPAAEEPEQEKRRRRAMLLLLLLLSLLVLLTGIALWYFLFRQPIPLPLPTVIDLPGYTTSIYGSTTPIGVATSPDGSRIYVAQSGGDRTVAIFDARGNRVGVAQPPVSSGDEHVPVWLAIDPITSQLYVSDRPAGEVYVFDQDGGYMHSFALAVPIGGWQPIGLAFDAAGNLYVADLAAARARVEKFDRSGNLVQTFGEADRLSFPNGVAVDKAGNVIVADSNNGRLLAYRPDGTALAQVGRGVGVGELGMPRGLAIDGRGRIYVGDTTAQGVLVFGLAVGQTATDQPAPGSHSGPIPVGYFGGRTYVRGATAQALPAPPGGTSPPSAESGSPAQATGAIFDYLGFIGGPGVEDGRFTFPNGVAADGRGRIYVSDTGNNRIQIWSY